MQPLKQRPEPDDAPFVPFPATALAAGVVWIVFGGLILVFVLIGLAVHFASDRGAVAADAGVVGAIGGMGAALIMGLIGGVFLNVGIQTARGTASDTLGNGIGSIIFGVGDVSFLIWMIERARFLQIVIYLSVATTLITAGVLALVGRNGYRAWRRAHRDRFE